MIPASNEPVAPTLGSVLVVLRQELSASEAAGCDRPSRCLFRAHRCCCDRRNPLGEGVIGLALSAHLCRRRRNRGGDIVGRDPVLGQLTQPRRRRRSELFGRSRCLESGRPLTGGTICQDLDPLERHGSVVVVTLSPSIGRLDHVGERLDRNFHERWRRKISPRCLCLGALGRRLDGRRAVRRRTRCGELVTAGLRGGGTRAST